MSMQRSGLGGSVGQSPAYESDFANSQGVGSTPDGQSWNAGTLDAQKSEVS